MKIPAALLSALSIAVLPTHAHADAATPGSATSAASGPSLNGKPAPQAVMVPVSAPVEETCPKPADQAAEPCPKPTEQPVLGEHHPRDCPGCGLG